MLIKNSNDAKMSIEGVGFFKQFLKLSFPQWHLGFHKKEFTPMYRGFETHYGYYLGCGDYYDHTSEANEVNMIHV